jgi:hypothetical protein
MFEKITLRVFFVCLVCCASMILYGIWALEKPPEVYFKTAATFFITGLACFLSWFVVMLYTLRRALTSSS